MNRRALLFLLIIAVIFAGISCWQRYRIEESNNYVDLVMDYQAITPLLEEEGDGYLLELKREGLTSIALYQNTIKELLEHQEIHLLRAEEITQYEALTGEIKPRFKPFPFQKDSMFITIEEPYLAERFLDYLPFWQQEISIDYLKSEEDLTIFFPEWKNNYINLNLGFDRELVERVKAMGFKVITRVNNKNGLNQSLLEEYSPEYIIFQGKEVTGYPDKIEKTAEIMKSRDIKFAMIEAFIARQSGAEKLAKEIDYDLVRVHSIQQGEMEKYTVDRVVARYLRAVRERNVQILYLKPFLTEKDGTGPVELNREYFRLLAGRLREEGYHTGQIQSFPRYSNSNFALLITGLGITAAGIILLELLFNIKLVTAGWVLLLLTLTGELGLLYLGREILLRQILALGSSIIFPALAVIWVLRKKWNNFWFINFLKAAAISLLGALFLVASLAHISFMLKIDQFRGVKLAFILPLILVTFYYLRTSTGKDSGYWYKKVINFLEINIKVKHLLLMLVLATGGIVYIGRTGNYPLLPVPAWELYLRDWLEKYLTVRPRFKEFLFGHPFLVVVLGLKEKIGDLVFYPLLVLASVGQLTLLNTFSHIHTPLRVSIIRVFHGLWLGLLIGLIFLVILRFLLQLWRKLKGGIK